MIIERIFYPVGQGAFFSEAHRNADGQLIVIVYDCGSDNKSDLLREINAFGYRSIDYLVISHFHRDHINGITELLDSGVTVNTLFIPKLTNAEKVIFYIECGIESAIYDPAQYFRASRVIEVSDEFQDADEIDLNAQQIPSVVSHKSNFVLVKTREWILRFYVDRSTFEKMSKVDKDYLDAIVQVDLKNKTKMKKAKTIYAKLPGDFNSTSMSMYSGQKCIKANDPKVIEGVLLNGDADLSGLTKISIMVDHYKQQKNLISIFGIPHHGSHHNMTHPILDFSYSTAYIQCGFISKHGHPSGSVINFHESVGITVNVITEKSSARRINHGGLSRLYIDELISEYIESNSWAVANGYAKELISYIDELSEVQIQKIIFGAKRNPQVLSSFGLLDLLKSLKNRLLHLYRPINELLFNLEN